MPPRTGFSETPRSFAAASAANSWVSSVIRATASSHQAKPPPMNRTLAPAAPEASGRSTRTGYHTGALPATAQTSRHVRPLSAENCTRPCHCGTNSEPAWRVRNWSHTAVRPARLTTGDVKVSLSDVVHEYEPTESRTSADQPGPSTLTPRGAVGRSGTEAWARRRNAPRSRLSAVNPVLVMLPETGRTVSRDGVAPVASAQASGQAASIRGGVTGNPAEPMADAGSPEIGRAH